MRIDPNAIIAQFPHVKIFWLAYSGGRDSHALLHMLANDSTLAIKDKIRVIHINHGLSADADDWESHCAQICQTLAIPYQCVRIAVQLKRGASLEANARQARYQALAKVMQTGDCLLTAHHQDDQAETLLLQLVRGAGVKGLAAMPGVTNFGKGYLWRPLLAVSRAQIIAYARQQQLHWIEDDSNGDQRFDRNYMRHQIIPALTSRWPGALSTISRSAGHCAEADQLLDELAQIDLAACAGLKSGTLSISSILQLSPARQRLLLRHWLVNLRLSLPAMHKIIQIQAQVLCCREDAKPLVTWPGVEVRRYRDDLYAMSPLYASALQYTASWDLIGALHLPGELGTLRAYQVAGKGFVLTTPFVTVRFRQGGERCHPLGRDKSQSLKKLFQAWGVPPWERARIPLLYHDDQLVSVAGLCVHKDFAAQTTQQGWQISYE